MYDMYCKPSFTNYLTLKPIKLNIKLNHLSLSIIIIFFLACGGGSGGNDENGVTPTPDEMNPVEPTPTPIQNQTLRLTSAEPTINEGNARYTEFAGVDLNAQRLLSRVTVNVAAGGESISGKAIAYARFTARSSSGALRANLDWHGTLTSAINLSSSTEMLVHLRVREINPNGSAGPQIFSRQLERDGIGSGLKAAERLTVQSSANEAYELNLKQSQPYRIEVELECRLRVEVISFALVDCNAESGNRGLNVNALEIMY
jgi:hypothetical protein